MTIVILAALAVLATAFALSRCWLLLVALWWRAVRRPLGRSLRFRALRFRALLRGLLGFRALNLGALRGPLRLLAPRIGARRLGCRNGSLCLGSLRGALGVNALRVAIRRPVLLYGPIRCGAVLCRPGLRGH